MGIGGLMPFGRFRIVGLLVSLVSLLGMGLRFGMVIDSRGTTALKHCAAQAALSMPAATKAARCFGTAAVAIWTRRAGQLIPVASVGR
ncbi:MAG: hypothetical protein ABI647_16620 [Gemmatimonadota bacterium]